MERDLDSQENHRENSDNHKKKKPFTVLTRFYARPFTEDILKEHRFIYEGKRKDFYYYDQDNGLWINNAEDYIAHYFRKLTDTIDDSLKKIHVISEIVADIQGYTWEQKGTPEPPINLIPCKNGVYDLKHDVFRNFEAEDFFTWKLPFNYNPDAKCPFLERVINTTLPDEEVITLWELMAYSFYRGYPLHKFFLLVGGGSNGKGTFMTIFIKMLSPENVSNISLTDIQNNRFAISNLYRKLANISGEMSYCDIADTALLKQLTGGDQIEADRKFKKSVKFVNFAKLIFSTNQVPKTFDTTDAFYRRAFIVSFPRKFKVDPSLDIKIRENSEEMTREYEGLLCKTLGHLKVLMKNNFTFTKEQVIETVRKRYAYLSNPLVQFIDECCERTYQGKDFIYKYEFLQKLNEWIIERKMNAYTQEKIGTEMKGLGYEDAKKGSPNKEKRYLAWVGLKWKPSDSVNLVNPVKVVSNSSYCKGESVVNTPANPDNLDTSCNNLTDSHSDHNNVKKRTINDKCNLCSRDCMMSENQKELCGGPF
jgi:putative DNA primase/helicase